MWGIDVSARQGEIDWARVHAAGVGFAMIRAGAGKEADGRFARNCMGASAAGLSVGVYHTLASTDFGDAIAEADAFAGRIAPWRDKIGLWVCCAAEREVCGPGVHGFLRRVCAAGFSAMLYTDPAGLTRLDFRGEFPLWLCCWNVPEARAVGFNPRVWQYDSGHVPGVGVRVPLNRGYWGYGGVAPGK